jgi:hypothetical protein
MPFMPNILRDYKNLREGLAPEPAILQKFIFILQASWRHDYIVEKYSQRTTDLPIPLGG